MDSDDDVAASATSATAAASATASAEATTAAKLLMDRQMPSSTLQASADDLPWVEKHRPRVLADVVGNREAVERLAIIAQQGNMPNIIVTGPPGTGKTTSVVCLARELLGVDRLDSALLELNASDSRGIDVVRNKIKMFAQKKVTLAAGRQKLVILDEADSMTAGAQQALRRTMELYSSTTRFALACNTSSKIIEPIQSRCAILRFTKLDDREVLQRVREVMVIEKVTAYDDEGLKALLFTAQGDMRQALNNLQATHTGMGAITAANIYKVVDQPHPNTLTSMLSSCYAGELMEALAELRKLTEQGYAAIDLIGTLFRVCKNSNINDHMKLLFIKEISSTHMRVSDGVDTSLQLAGLFARLTGIARANGHITGCS